MMDMVCEGCGRKYNAIRRNQKYCSQGCRERKKYRDKREARTGVRKPYRHAYDPIRDADESRDRISRIEKAAAAAGMSYGKYVAKYGV